MSSILNFAMVNYFSKFTKLICIIIVACTLHTDLAYGNESIDKNCNLYRFVYFSNLIETSAFLNANISKNSFKINDLKADLNREIGNKNNLPIDITITSQIYKTDSNTFNSQRLSKNEVNELTGKIGIDLWNELSRRRVSNYKQSLISHNISSLKSSNDAEIIISLIELSKTKSLIKLLEIRENLLTQKVEYFSLRKELGENVSQQLLETRKSRVENLNKISSANVKVSNLISKLEISYKDYDEVLPLPTYLNVEKNFKCSAHLNSYTEAKKSLDLLNVELTDKNLDFGPKINAFIKETENKNNIGYFDNEIKYGVEISFPLFEGGRKIRQRQNILERIENKEYEVKKLQKESVRINKQRAEIEYVLSNSLGIISNTLEEKKSLLIELSERMQLGQSLFVEVSDASLEENLLEESGLNLVAQFLIGWVNYLEQIGQVNSHDYKL